MSGRERGRPAALFLLALAASLAYLVPKSLGLLDDVGGSRLNRDATFSVALRTGPLLVTGAFLAAAGLLVLLRGPAVRGFGRAAAAAGRRPVRSAALLAVLLLLLHLPLFVPFRVNQLRIPVEGNNHHEWVGRRGELVRVPRDGSGYEDYTRNYVTARALSSAGAGSFFRLPDAPGLTPVDRRLCRWSLTNHPPGWFFLLAPATGHPVTARLLSVVLYAVLAGLSFLLLEALLGAVPALLAAVLFWATPSGLWYVGMGIGNDLPVAVVLVAALLVTARSRRPGARTAAVAGLLLGVAFWIKYTAIMALPGAALILLLRSGFRRGLARSAALAGGFLLPAAGWILLLASTPWGAVQYERYVGRLLAKAVDPANVGAATSTARGTLLDLFAYVPAELGFALALVIVLAVVGLVRRGRRAGGARWTCLLLYLVPLLAAVLTIPKTNYVLFALPALVGLAGAFLADRSNRTDAVLAAATMVLFGLGRAALYGYQTW